MMNPILMMILTLGGFMVALAPTFGGMFLLALLDNRAVSPERHRPPVELAPV